MSLRQSTSFLISLLLSAAPVFGAGKAAPANDLAAKSLAGLLKPLGLTPQADKNKSEVDPRLIDQAKKVLTAMQKSEIKAGPGAEELLNTAFRYRPDVGQVQRAVVVGTMREAWREAYAMGLFDEKNNWTDSITRGVDAGQKPKFEYIVPPKDAPDFSLDLSNIRITPPSKARVSAALTKNDEAYVKTLESVKREIEGMKKLAAIKDGGPRNVLGQTPKQAHDLWQAEVDAAGESAKDKPSIILKGLFLASPQKNNGSAWKVQAKVTNLSLHPTEVEVQCWVIGSTWKKHENFIMLQDKKKVELRKGQEETLVFTTLASSVYKARSDDYEKLDPKKERPKSHVNYRGFIFRVVHEKGDTSITSSEETLEKLVDGDAQKSLSTIPNFFVDPKAPQPVKK